MYMPEGCFSDKTKAVPATSASIYPRLANDDDVDGKKICDQFTRGPLREPKKAVAAVQSLDSSYCISIFQPTEVLHQYLPRQTAPHPDHPP
jgi:hypothetical protein